MDRQQFATAAADVFAHYSPERTGITAEVWNNASAMSRPDIGSYRPVPDSLVPVFERLAVPRVRERTPETGRGPSTPDEKEPPSLERRLDDKLHELRARRHASYAKPATGATHTAPELGDGAQP